MFPIPSDVTQVKSFLGLAGFYRPFIKDYGRIAAPLTYLLKKDVPWRWDEEQGRANVAADTLSRAPIETSHPLRRDDAADFPPSFSLPSSAVVNSASQVPPLEPLHKDEVYAAQRADKRKVSCDTLSGFATSRSGNKHILVFVDNFSRYCELVAVPSKAAVHVTKAFNDVICCRHGCPQYLSSDNGTEFVNQVLASFAQQLNVTQANGVTERLNRSILTILRQLVDDSKDDWDALLPTVQSAINSTFHSSLGDSPHFLLTGQDKRLPYELLEMKPRPLYADNYANYLVSRQQQAFQQAKALLTRSRDRIIEYQHKIARAKNIGVGCCRPYSFWHSRGGDSHRLPHNVENAPGAMIEDLGKVYPITSHVEARFSLMPLRNASLLMIYHRTQLLSLRGNITLDSSLDAHDRRLFNRILSSTIADLDSFGPTRIIQFHRNIAHGLFGVVDDDTLASELKKYKESLASVAHSFDSSAHVVNTLAHNVQDLASAFNSVRGKHTVNKITRRVNDLAAALIRAARVPAIKSFVTDVAADPIAIRPALLTLPTINISIPELHLRDVTFGACYAKAYRMHREDEQTRSRAAERAASDPILMQQKA
ncbi:integrase core domain containing protein [Penaeus vannamei]|uniref:RNA-directed DNA polymerase n=1 Tax=Penaeus vannamei TaxID=6689 RepID=A0A3R7N4S9_PENVA|nr:integrase core domain containing protein [Penaeus vannamei]